MGMTERKQFLQKVHHIAEYIGDDLKIERDNRDEVLVQTTTPHYIPRGRIYKLILPGGHDVSVQISSWVGQEQAGPDQEYSLEDFLAIRPEEYGRFGYEYTQPL